MLIPVILSGGAGTRLWPASRRAWPKPFMPVGGVQSLLERTLQRARHVAPAGPVYTVTHEDHYFLSRDAFDRQPAAGECRFLLEPLGRNTAPAIALAAQAIRELYGSQAVLLVLPADHLIADLDAFAHAVEQARTLALSGQLVTFGIVPDQPETGYGYIRSGAALPPGRTIEAFVEKPDLATAQQYVASGDYLWNSGMFAFRADTLLEAMRVHAPGVHVAVAALAAATDWNPAAVRFPREAFAALPDISIDYAVMEQAHNRAVIPARFDWNDIGSWKAIAALGTPDASGNRQEGEAVLVRSQDCYVRSAGRRVVALVGVQDLLVVDTEDAVLIAHRDAAQDVRQVTDQLSRAGHEAAQVHRTVRRPWGSYTVLEDAADCKVKRLTVNPGHILSLQMHHRRSEHWTVVAGTARVTVGERTFDLGVNQSVEIPSHTRHRLENATDQPIALIEVQCGEYFGEDDIVRFEDRYGRC